MCGQSEPANGLQNDIFSFRKIYQAYLDCRKNKRNTFNALKFEINDGENLVKLEYELKNRTYHPSRSILFAAKKPKLREIFAADFPDRVVHHILVNSLEKIYEPIFIHDSYASRDGKGTHAAKERLEKFTRQITKNGHVRAYYLQLDIKDFFTSINKELLFIIIQRKVKNPDILWLTQKVLFWDCTTSYVHKGDKQLLFNIPTNKSLFGKENRSGLPIGNLTSQYFANIYLNELDQYVKHVLKAHYYLRYVDDFVILSQDASQLRTWQAQIEEFLLSRLKLRLHPKRRKLASISNGIDFLGYIIRPTYVLVRRRVINNLKEKIRQFRQAREKDFRKFHDMVASYMGHFKHANSYRLINKLTMEVA
ncbi:MAG: reverse transcriptase [Candidatus Omnitrophica bacterium]|nr:reverse transcriptase [Candidatus Omnitrophota bacterium]